MSTNTVWDFDLFGLLYLWLWLKVEATAAVRWLITAEPFDWHQHQDRHTNAPTQIPAACNLRSGSKQQT